MFDCVSFFIFVFSFNVFHSIIKLLLFLEMDLVALRKEGAFSLLNVTFELTEKGLDAVEEIGSGKPSSGEVVGRYDVMRWSRWTRMFATLF